MDTLAPSAGVGISVPLYIAAYLAKLKRGIARVITQRYGPLTSPFIDALTR
jgi:hypothetical protein